ncbi:MAG: cell division ATP-binding protein FtsE [Candidatus Gastranaerophilales bacterium]|nr:cell division ATP-binding protein FtsE [Candidatus Gastranaerophilales bacterium]
MIQLRSITKKYKNNYALRNVNLDILSGEFVFVVGASGAGKSTLMKLLYKEETPSSGTVMIGGINIANLPSDKVPNLRRCMGIVFQDYKLLQNQSVYDNVAYVIRTLGISTKEINARVLGALKVVGLSDKIKAKPTELSGGEQQRVSIARAIVNGPPLLIADEPTGNLDPKNSMEVMQILDQINQRGITVIVSTHDSAMVDYFRKRVITLENGEVVRDIQAGTYEQQ